jgi:hypothetical protein
VSEPGAVVPVTTPGALTVTMICWVARIYREAVNKIDTYSQRVKQGQDAQAALEFGGFILWSGIIPLCREIATDSHPKIDGSHLQWLAEELQRDARERLSFPGKPAKIDATQLEAINRKLDVIAAQIQRCGLGR